MFEVYKEVPLASVEEVFDFINPIKLAQKGIDLNDYIFRGEGSLKYKLMPSGCRENN